MDLKTRWGAATAAFNNVTVKRDLALAAMKELRIIGRNMRAQGGMESSGLFMRVTDQCYTRLERVNDLRVQCGMKPQGFVSLTQQHLNAQRKEWEQVVYQTSITDAAGAALAAFFKKGPHLA